MTLALLLTAVGGAWAQGVDYDIYVGFAHYYNPMETNFNCMITNMMDPGAGIKGTLEISVDGESKGSFNVDGEMVFGSIAAIDAGGHTWSAVFKPEGGGSFKRTGPFTIDKENTSISYNGSTSINLGVGESTELDVNFDPHEAGELSYSSSDASVVSITKENSIRYIIQAEAAGTATITFSFAGNKNYEAAEDLTITVTVLPAPIEVTPGEAANTWTFSMPANDVVLTPIYSAATIYSGQTETPFETLKEAFANVKNGDVIKLDWNVTLTETLKTPSTASDISFTLDFNGFVIDNTGGSNYIVIDNGCKLTLTDNSTAQTGGLKSQYPIAGSNGGKFIFQGGRYSFSGCSSQEIALEWDRLVSTYGWVMGDGKEFVDLNNGQPDDDGFMVRVDWKTYELTIGAGRFATFFDSNRIKLADGTDTNIGLYTISSINADRSTATVTPISGIIPAGTPMLVYNGTEQKQTAKLIVTLDNAQGAIAWDPQFKGTATDHEFTADEMAAADYYALSGGKAFAPVKGAGILGANQCWLQFDKQEITSARQFTLVFDSEATGIKTTDCTDYTDSVWYDLNGRKVAAPSKKGIYIMNGKKVVVK